MPWGPISRRPSAFDTKINEQFQEDIRNERLLEDTNASTHSIDSLRETLKISKADYNKAKKLMQEGDTVKTNTICIDEENWEINKNTGQVIPVLAIIEDDCNVVNMEQDTPNITNVKKLAICRNIIENSGKDEDQI